MISEGTKIKEVKGFKVWKKDKKVSGYQYTVESPRGFTESFKNLRKVDQFFKRMGIVAVILLVSFNAFAMEIPSGTAVRAIVGEAEGESMAGKEAVGHALINRSKMAYYKRFGVFSGVYGLKRKIRASEAVWREARVAWERAGNNPDNTNGATVWGTDADVKKFRKESWFKNYELTKRIGNHNFFRVKS